MSCIQNCALAGEPIRGREPVLTVRPRIDIPSACGAHARMREDGDPGDVIQDSTHSRAKTRHGAAVDGTAKGNAITRDATGSLDPHAASDTDTNKPQLPTTRAVVPEHIAAGTAGWDAPNHHGWP
ncbi:hypothetical protein EVAR_80508_1 [Eumeta japonica]|uniref:Uncharacterized protein n=1 Tax=Eumeta variegata TaxID=151549 RepID=A0A4C1TNL1_EUMVA|nr:hypothetical protein EVAR_80508_1 [Eumeta japonica]